MANRGIVPCTCRGWETVNCTKLCECSPEYAEHVGELEYASWFPIRPAKAKRARQPIYMDPQRVRELAAPRGVGASLQAKALSDPPEVVAAEYDRMVARAAAVDAKAREIYDGWKHLPSWVPWVEGGNSQKQDEARRAALASGVAMPVTPSEGEPSR